MGIKRITPYGRDDQYYLCKPYPTDGSDRNQLNDMWNIMNVQYPIYFKKINAMKLSDAEWDAAVNFTFVLYMMGFMEGTELVLTPPPLDGIHFTHFDSTVDAYISEKERQYETNSYMRCATIL